MTRTTFFATILAAIFGEKFRARFLSKWVPDKRFNYVKRLGLEHIGMTFRFNNVVGCWERLDRSTQGTKFFRYEA